MSNGWSGPDPVAFTDAGADYELGTRYGANGDITANGIRVWGGPASTAQPARRARVLSAGGIQQAIAALPDQLLPGWNTYPLNAPLPIAAGTVFWVSYGANETYGAATGQVYPKASGDGLVTAQTGGLNNVVGGFPDSLNNTTFYGVDVDYTASLTGNQRPVVGITTTAPTTLTASALLTIADEAPATVSYVIEWGDGTSSSVTTLGPHAHVYAAAGVYAVMVTATDAGGLSDSAAAVVSVLPDPGPVVPDPWLDQICTYFGGPYVPAFHSYRTPTVVGIGTVRRGVPKVQDWADYTAGMAAGTSTGCNMTVTMNDGDERRVNPPAVTGLKHQSVTVVLHCFFYSMSAYGEDLQDQVHTVRRAILARIRQDNTLGSGGFENRMFQVGEADQHGAGGGITWGTSPPETNEDNTSEQYLYIQFEAHGFVTG